MGLTEKLVERIGFDLWFKPLFLVSFVILLLALSFQGLEYKNSIILISLGAIIFSLGEWKQQGFRVRIEPMG